MKKTLLFALILASGPHLLFAELSPALMRDYEKIKVIYYDARSKEKRAELTYEISKENKNAPVYVLKRSGKGSCDKFVDMSWDTLAEITEKDDRLCVLNSKCSAHDKDGTMLLGYEKIFDYAKGKIYWTQFDKNGKTAKKVTFPIKGITTDDVTMAFFLKSYVKHINEPGYNNFYLLTNEPKLYKVNFKLMGIETLDLPIGKKRALKIKTTADMGIVDDILDKYVPHTYFWYEDSPSLQWLQYQGLETSMNSAYIKALITELQTSSPLSD